MIDGRLAAAPAVRREQQRENRDGRHADGECDVGTRRAHEVAGHQHREYL